MSYFLTFENAKPRIVDDAETFHLMGAITIVTYADCTSENLIGVTSISAHFYNEG